MRIEAPHAHRRGPLQAQPAKLVRGPIDHAGAEHSEGRLKQILDHESELGSAAFPRLLAVPGAVEQCEFYDEEDCGLECVDFAANQFPR